jgi:hypothetical protein
MRMYEGWRYSIRNLVVYFTLRCLYSRYQMDMRSRPVRMLWRREINYLTLLGIESIFLCFALSPLTVPTELCLGRLHPFETLVFAFCQREDRDKKAVKKERYSSSFINIVSECEAESRS